MDIKRILSYYNRNNLNHINDMGSIWDNNIVIKHSSKLFNLLNTQNINIISNVLQNISNTDICFGYEVCCNGFYDDNLPIIYKTFEKLLDEMGIQKLYINNILDIETLLPLIDDKCGFKVEFPDIFDYSNLSKLICSRGKVSHRMIFALYYVWNITQNVENVKECSILEIGAGLGRTAYYASKFGFKKYTIVDIISTGIMQFHYNYHLLGSENVSLFGEDNFNTCFLNLMPADKFNIINEKYNLICNFDGLT